MGLIASGPAAFAEFKLDKSLATPLQNLYIRHYRELALNGRQVAASQGRLHHLKEHYGTICKDRVVIDRKTQTEL